jgi:dihydropyrimidinase
LVVSDGELKVARGSGQFIKRSTPEPVLRQRLNGNPNSVMRKYFSVDPSEKH